MSRPLLITDCDEVLLHMITPFGGWLDAVHAIDFHPVPGDFANAMIRRETGEAVTRDEIWALLDGFFATEMHRQPVVPGAVAALEEIAAVADVVVLTNIGERHRDARAAQLAAFGVRHRVVCNQAGKGTAVAALVAEFAPCATVFVDDLHIHHSSVARRAPEVHRLHMIAEPALAAVTPPAADAHARIDDWPAATRWILDRFGREHA